MIGGAKGIGLGLDFGIGNQSRPSVSGNYLDPTVKESLCGVWIADQNTNNSTYRNIIKNKFPNRGGDFEILNAAYKLNSGYGLYNYDYTTFNILADLSRVIDRTKVEIFAAKGAVGFYRIDTTYKGRIKITGLTKAIGLSEVLYFQIYTNATDNNEAIKLREDGIYDIDIKGLGTNVNRIYFYAVSNGIIAKPLTEPIYLEQVPEFDGAFVTDGVDDVIMSRNTISEITNKSNEMTLVSMVHQLSYSYNDMAYTNIIRSDNNNYVRNDVYQINKTGIYGFTSKDTTKTIINNILGDKNDYKGGTTNNTIPSTLNANLSISAVLPNTYNSSVAWYWTFIANKVLTSFEIEQVMAYYNLDKYVTPSVYYDVKKQGITNDNHSQFSDKLIDYSGNKRDLQLYNIGWGEESGINKYENQLVLDGVNDYGQYVGNLGLKNYTFIMNRSILKDKITASCRLAKSGTESYTNTPFLFESYNIDGLLSNVYSYGSATGFNKEATDGWSYLSTYNYNGTNVARGAGTGEGNGLFIGSENAVSNYTPVAISHVLLYPYSLNKFLIDRQLRKLKAGTLYEGMVQFIPRITTTNPYKNIQYFNNANSVAIFDGDYLPIGTKILIRVTPASDMDYVSNITINGERPKDYPSNDGNFRYTFVVNKSINKIDITIDQYIKFEDISQPYPVLLTFYDKETNEVYDWGSKIKVGTVVKVKSVTNLFKDLYAIDDYSYNGKNYNYKEFLDEDFIVNKDSIKFSVVKRYLLDNNPPKVIYSPQTLKLTNDTYKLLGYIPDLSGNDNNGIFNNFAFKDMSGAGGYVEDFSAWNKYTFANVTYNKISIFRNPDANWVIYTTSGHVIDPYKIKVSGIPADGEIVYRINNVNTILVNGINKLEGATVSAASGFYITKHGITDWKDLVIEQLPKYEGSIILDGVDDFVTIPSLDQGFKEVLLKLNYQTHSVVYDQRANPNIYNFAISTKSSDVLAYRSMNANGVTYINGVLNTDIKNGELINTTHNIVETAPYSVSDTASPIIGCDILKSNYSKMALYNLMLFDNISSNENILKLNEIVGIENSVKVETETKNN